MTNGYHLKELKIEINRNCPLRCLHCSSNGAPHAPEQLDPKKVSELIREFVYLGGEKFRISGGEPLCYEGLHTIIDACRMVNVQTAIYTTGITSNGGSPKPIPDRITALLAENNIQVIFSLHGASAKTHDTLTGIEGSFDATMRATQKVLKAEVAAEVHVVPTNINFHELATMIELLVSVNIHKVSWLRFVPQGRGFFNRNALQLSSEQIGRLAEIKEEVKQSYPTITLRTGAPFNILCSEAPVPCDAGLRVLTIRPDGSIAPCDAFKQFRIRDEFSSVLDHSLSDIWNKSYLLNAVRGIQETRLTSSCASCELFPQCNSGCLAQKAIVLGSLTHNRDPDCPLTDEKVRGHEVERILIH